MKERKYLDEISKSAGPFSTKTGAKHPCVTGIQVCSNEGSHPLPFLKRDNYEIAKIT